MYIYIYTHGITQFIAALIGKVMISHHIAAFPLRFSWALSCPLLGTLWPIPETIAGAIHPDAGAIRQEEMDPRFLFDTWDTKILWVCIQCSIYIYIEIYIEYQYITLFIIYIMSCNSNPYVSTGFKGWDSNKTIIPWGQKIQTIQHPSHPRIQEGRMTQSTWVSKSGKRCHGNGMASRGPKKKTEMLDPT